MSAGEQMAEGGKHKAGGVPEGWREVQLGEVASVSSGSTPNRSDTRFWDGDIPWITTGEINYNEIHDSEEKITSEALEETAVRLFPKDGILMAMYGQGATRGRVARLRIDATTNQACAYINAYNDSDNDFLYQLFFASYESLRELGHGGNQKNLSGQHIKSFPFLLPPLPEQRKIAAILSTWDDSLATLTNLLAAKRQQKRGLAEALLTGKKRLPGFEGEWEETRLGRHIFEVSQRNKNSAIERVLSVTNHSGFVLPEEQFSKRVASENISNYKVVRKGQFAYNPSRLNVGSLARLDNFSEGVVSPLYVVFDVVDSLDRNHLLYWLESPLAESKIKASVQGSVRDSVSFDALSSFAISLPPLPEQQAIASILSTLDGEIASLEALKAKVQEQKRGLMDELLTGRVRVKVV